MWLSINIVELYQEAKKESLERAAPAQRGGKAEEVRKIVLEISRESGEKKLLAAAVYRVVKTIFEQRGEKLDRPYFTQIVKKKPFQLVTENGRQYIIVP